MKVILIDKQTKKATVYSVKTDLCKELKVSAGTLWNWSKEKIKETPNYLIYFDVCEFKNKSLYRPGSQNNLKPRF